MVEISMNIKLLAIILALVGGTSSSLHSQVNACRSVSFSGFVNGTDTFAHEIGGGIWFTVFSDSIYPGGSWTMRIGEGKNPQERYDIGWGLKRGLPPEWELGADYKHDAETAMKSSPRELWFAVSRSDVTRLRAAQYRQTSSDSRVAFANESDPGKVIAEVPKGLASVSIVDYRLTEADTGKRREIVSVAFNVTVIVPQGVPLLNGVPAACPAFPFSAKDTATW
jgi:hypothetical protein